MNQKEKETKEKWSKEKETKNKKEKEQREKETKEKETKEKWSKEKEKKKDEKVEKKNGESLDLGDDDKEIQTTESLDEEEPESLKGTNETPIKKIKTYVREKVIISDELSKN